MSGIRKVDKRLSANLLKFYRANPVIAAQELLVRNGKPIRLMPPQQKVLTDWWNSNFGILTASRGFGKTFVSSVFIALKATLYPGIKIGIIAPTFRQSQLIFDEFKLLVDNSPLLAAEIDKYPTKQTDKCVCIFKAARGQRPSQIIALPLGNDGKKIRGNRFNILLIEECVHVPPSVFQAAIKPMLSTTLDPIEAVEMWEKIERGELDKSALENITSNGFYAITSAYYKFNYWWQEIEIFAEEIAKARAEGKVSPYTLHFIPWYHMPKGFFQEHIIRNSQASDPEHVFLTEWCATWIDDSAGAFKMSLLKACQDLSCVPRTTGRPNKEYIIGVDPARKNDSSAVAIIEIDDPCKLVHLEELIDVPWPEQAKRLMNIFKRFNVKAIYMDMFGGGQTLADSWASKEFCTNLGVTPIVPADMPPGQAAGARRILYEIKPSSQVNEDINDAALKVLEERWVVLPPQGGEIEIPKNNKLDENGNPIVNYRSYEILGSRKTNMKDGDGNTRLKKINLVEELINQMASVVVTETKTGRLSYGLPKNKGSAGSESLEKLSDYKKDLYSAFILAAKGVYDLEFVPKYDTIQLATGLVRQISEDPSSSFLSRGLESGWADNTPIVSAGSGNIVSQKRTKSGGEMTTFPWGIVVGKGNGRKRR